ncbi:ATP-grasp domain-containing protein [Croceivirga sp. JEA036]|uniref:ATP-grasp domain-containing protein n=1 Tax=Croceivirga sp. JEA036 TaxID=2721162 RepID=UPI001438F859|nr:ATP-grasp domain-containing protein [Croceivirga sp. JEA036]NJB35359.1 ATP-grasp domain-containing protein [Croceivirga sp. JEA036]
MNVLITSAGRRVSLLKSFQKELKTRQLNSKVYAADANPVLSAACQVADDYFKVPRLDHSEYITFLLKKCIELKISLIIPTIDTELLLLSKHQNLFKEKGIIPIISDQALIEKCRDKRRIHEFFEDHDIAVAKEFSKDNFKLPIFIKPIDGSRSVDTYLIRKEEDLTEYHLDNDKLMFLEYLDHNEFDEFTCDLYFDKSNELKCVVPRKRIEVRDGEVNKGKTCNNELVIFLRNTLRKVDGAIGCLTAQFFMHKHTNKIYGIEINPRFGGGYPLSYLSGANYSGWIIDEYLLNKNIPDSFDCWEADLLMLRYDAEVLVHEYKN